MNIKNLRVRAMECMHAQTRPRFMLSSKKVLGNGVRSHVDSKEKIPSTGGSAEGRTLNTASGRTASLTHYRLICTGPHVSDEKEFLFFFILHRIEMWLWSSYHVPGAFCGRPS